MFGQARQRLVTTALCGSRHRTCDHPISAGCRIIFSTSTAPWLTPIVLRTFSNGTKDPDSFRLVAKGRGVPSAPRQQRLLVPHVQSPALPVTHDVEQAL